MDGDRTHRALLRIEAALARLEAAPVEPPRTDESDLEARHARLRGAVGDALGRLDQLIAEQSR